MFKFPFLILQSQVGRGVLDKKNEEKIDMTRKPQEWKESEEGSDKERERERGKKKGGGFVMVLRFASKMTRGRLGVFG